jgi:hypothetical protein
MNSLHPRLRMFATEDSCQVSPPRAVGHFCRFSSSAMPVNVIIPRAWMAPITGSILGSELVGSLFSDLHAHSGTSFCTHDEDVVGIGPGVEQHSGGVEKRSSRRGNDNRGPGGGEHVGLVVTLGRRDDAARALPR